MKKIALYPGFFDPITLGHVEVVRRGLKLFDEIIIGVGINAQKSPMFPDELRKNWVERIFADESNVHVTTYQELTVAYARSVGACAILRGLRNSVDYEYERTIDQVNKQLDPEMETVFLFSGRETSHLSSTIVREVIRWQGSLDGLVPQAIIPDVYQYFAS
jgi:pantetheine-phosphate adenylyltransferase